jgi:hypothetical protein
MTRVFAAHAIIADQRNGERTSGHGVPVELRKVSRGKWSHARHKRLIGL